MINKSAQHFAATISELVGRHGILGLSAENLEKEMSRWWRQHKPQFAHSDSPPKHSTMRRWMSGEERVMPQKLDVFCAYVLYRAQSDSAGRINWERSRTMAARMWEWSTPDFLAEYQNIVRTPAALDDVTIKVPVADGTLTKLMAAAIEAIHEAQLKIQTVINDLEKNPDAIDEAGLLLDADLSGKSTTPFDIVIEDLSRSIFKHKFGSEVHVVGEESLPKPPRQFSGWNKRYCVLLDVMDGTDLVPLADLWCSAIAIYDRDNARVLGACVGLPSGKICFARYDEQAAWVGEFDSQNIWRVSDTALGGCSDVVELSKAHIGFYGQKPRSFLSVAKNRNFVRFLEEKLNGKKVNFRLYNFAGNPLILRLADRKRTTRSRVIVASGIDAIFEVLGQRPHDFVPGAFIAKRAGAFLSDLLGNEISDSRLGAMMAAPDERFSYIIAATPQLAMELASVLSGTSHLPERV